MHHAVSHVWCVVGNTEPHGQESMACHGGDVSWMQRRGWVAVGSIDGEVERQ